MIKESIARLVERQDLTEGETSACMEEIMEGLASPSQIASFLTALRMKGETVEEFTGMARVMRARVTPLPLEDMIVVDTCGTGGDARNTFNISTAAAFVVAGAGLKVAKHGNKAATSLSGSADVLRLLGVNIEAGPTAVTRCIKEAGIGFLFAPLFHKSMRFASEPRKELGIRTAFNVLGPLTNPVPRSRQLIGVFSQALTETLAQVLKNLGTERALVASGLDGLDELTTTDKTKITELKGGSIKTFYLQPEDLGIKRASLKDLEVHSAQESAEVIKGILGGLSLHHKGAGQADRPKRDIVLLNAAAAIMVGGLAGDLREGLSLATQSLDSGRASQCLSRLVEVSCRGEK
ncbi:MAG: anthranilate phosphoribosyltransferase [Planctomycetes bacterium]|nr:anthranilate phosphoribosyltransferase [Planctomycetota bacterium]